jgi:hypothetical protein
MLALSLPGGGCDDVTLNVAPGPQRTLRPAPEPISSRRTATRPSESPAPARSSRIEPSYHQLVLTRDAAPAQAPPGLTYARLACAAPRQTAELLGLLYLPSGASGSSTRYSLIFPTAPECAAAAALVGQFDLPPANDPSEAAPADGLACAISICYRLQSETGDRSRFTGVMERLEPVGDSPQTSPAHRWAARMLAAGIRADRFSEFRASAELYSKAAGVAVPGSIEHLSSLYGEGHMLLQAGQTRRGRRVLETLIAQFGAMRRTEPFERARRLLAALEESR